MIAASVKDCQGKHFRVVTWLEKTNQMIAGSEGVSLKMSAKRKWFGEAISGKLVCRREVRLPAKVALTNKTLRLHWRKRVET